VRWRVNLSEYRFVIDRIPGDQNIVADGLTRVDTLIFNGVDKSKRRLYQNGSISRIFRLVAKGIEKTEVPRVVNEEGESGGEEEFEEWNHLKT